jgi:hypothetical protein
VVVEAAVGVVDEDAVAAAGAVVQGDEVEEVVAVEVDRLDVEGAEALGDVVGGDVGEHAGAVVGEQEHALLGAGEAGDDDVEVPVVVDVDELEVPGPADLVERHVVEGVLSSKMPLLGSLKLASPSAATAGWCRPRCGWRR